MQGEEGSERDMIVPVQQNDILLADIEAAKANKRHFHLWWLGQSGFLIQWQGRHLLVDPYLSDSLTAKYAGTDRPHVRMTEISIAPERLSFIDGVTSSHNHTDHFDPDTLKALIQVNPQLKLAIPEANRVVSAARIGVKPDSFVGMDAGLVKSVGGFRVQGVPAAHNELDKNEWDEHLYLGYIIDLGMKRIYHAGDTLWYEGMEGWIRPFKVDVAILPINGNKPERKVAGNLDGREAARLAKAIGAKIAIPCHFEMFEFNTVTPDDFVDECQKIGQPFKVLKCGERWSSESLDALPAGTKS